MALVLPVLLILVFGIIDFGRALFTQQILTHATREGVRVYAVTQETDAASAAFWRSASELDSGATSVAVPGSGCTPGDPTRVSATTGFDFIVLPLPSMTLRSEAVMRCGG